MAKKKASKKRKKAGAAPLAKRTANARTRARKPKKPKRPEWYDRFLKAYRETDCVGAACDIIGRSTTSAYDHKNANDAFSDEWDEIKQRQRETLRGGMLHHAINGVPSRPMVIQHVTTVTDENGNTTTTRSTEVVPMVEHDTHLRKFMAANLMPEEFGKNPQSDEAAERAAIACALMEEMQNTVPEWVEE